MEKMEPGLVLSIVPMTAACAREALAWRYPPPYDFYNANHQELDQQVVYLTNPANGVFMILSSTGELHGICSYGRDARVFGGTYNELALDIGIGLRPDLTGRGLGAQYLAAVLDYGRKTFAPRAFRLTVAEFNTRAITLYSHFGFELHERFTRLEDALPFLVMLCPLD